MHTERLLLVGNPGVGKSTLLNGLIGEVKFASGVCFGTGLTARLQWVEHKGVCYGDTPGLADVDKRQQAAKEISEALRASGSYRLVFVCTLESGRVRPQDVTTMKLVLDALPADTPYAVVVNKISAKMDRKIKENEQALKAIVASLNVGHRPTPFMCFHPDVEELIDEDNAVVEPWGDFVDFLGKIPRKVIPREEVRDVNASEYEAELEKFESVIEEMRKNSKLQEQLFNEQRAAMQAQIQQLQKNDIWEQLLGVAAAVIEMVMRKKLK